jgi:hypothetical protein
MLYIVKTPENNLRFYRLGTFLGQLDVEPGYSFVKQVLHKHGFVTVAGPQGPDIEVQVADSTRHRSYDSGLFRLELWGADRWYGKLFFRDEVCGQYMPVSRDHALYLRNWGIYVSD